jgi:hypothetical protein
MNAKTLKALKGSIAHWERMRKADPTWGGEMPDAGSCALCAMFLNLSACDGCPVEAKTKLRICVGTPFSHASRIWKERAAGECSKRKWQLASTAELKFLKSLLPSSSDL